MIADRLDAIAPSRTKAMTARANALRRTGQEMLILSQGEPDGDTPATIREAGKRAIDTGHTRYTAVAGTMELRGAIQARLRADRGLHCSPDQITVGSGAKQVIFNALFATLNPGSEVIIPTPCWVSYPEMVRLAGGVPVLVPCQGEGTFDLCPEALAAAMTPRTRWLLLNSPHNPTGSVVNADRFREVAQVLGRRPEVWVLLDEIYDRLVYPPTEFVSLLQVAPELADRAMLVNGVSKSSRMTGWRLGYGAGPRILIEAMNTIQGQTTSHPCSIAQYAAIEALSGAQAHLPEFISELQERRDGIVHRLRAIPGLRCPIPAGAFYLWVHCGGWFGRRTPAGLPLMSDEAVADYLLESAGVAVVPGSAFLGSPYLRISFASKVEVLDQAADRIAEAWGQLR